MSFSRFREFIPKSYLYLRRGYTFASFRKDLAAGLTVGIIALPLAMAFAIASNVEPEQGLYTAIVAGFLISLLGGSRVQIGGPTGAFVVIVYEIVQRTGYAGLCVSMGIASVLLVLLGIFRIGSWIKYVPSPLITGFTTGIALIIFSAQIRDFFGLTMASPPADFVDKWIAYGKAFSTFNPTVLIFSLSTLALILVVRKYAPRIPWAIAAIVAATAASYFFGLELETIESRFDEIPRTLPWPTLPCWSWPIENFQELFINGVTIALLGAIESLLSAVIGDGMIGGNHRSNCELVAQGIANFASVLFGGIPATGAIARTAANVKTGAQTPMAGMIHAASLLLILFFLAPVVSQIPLCALAAILVMIAWNMSEMHHFIRLLRAPQADRIVLITVFLLTVFVDITAAILVGMILASFLFMNRMSQMSKAISLSNVFKESAVDFPERDDPNDLSKKEVPKLTEVYEIQGPFFFGAANILKDLLPNLLNAPKVFILRMRFVPMIDASGMYGIEEFYRQCKKKGVVLFLSEVHPHTKQDLQKFGLLDAIGEENIFPSFDKALKKSKKMVEED